MTQGFERDIGRMEADIKNLTKAVEVLTVKVDDISTTLSEAKGGWRLMVLLGGASATLGGLVVKFLPIFSAGK